MKLIFTLLALFGTLILQAQWTPNTSENTLVAVSGELDVQARGTSDGQTYVVFWKNVTAPTNIELRLQILDAAGNRKFGEDGMLVSDQLPMSTFTVIMNSVVDKDDNLYIGVTGTEDFSAYAFKIDLNGNHLWGTNGVNLGTGVPVTILPLSSGDAILSWHDSGPAVMQKFDSSGTPIWPTTKTIGSANTVAANLFELSNGDFEVIFHTILGGINSHLYAQRYDMNGDSIWPNAVQLANRTTVFNRNYPGIQDGDVVYMGYFASTGTRFDSYLQRINPDGTIPWGINGADFDVNETNYEMETEIVFEAGSQHLWSVVSYSNVTQSERGEFVQKFDKNSGARLFTENAKELFPIGSEKVHAGNLQLWNGNPLFLIKDGLDNGVSPITLHAVYLNENGDFAWPGETRPVATFSASKSRIQFTTTSNGQNVAVFVEDKGDGQKIYAQNVVDETAGILENLPIDIYFTNPVNDDLEISSNAMFIGAAVYNMLGQNIFQSEYSDESKINIPTHTWPAGSYILKLTTTNGEYKQLKLLKQ